MDVKRGVHSVYLMTYHTVFVVKYRRKVITPEMGRYMVERAKSILEGWGGSLIEGNPDQDHLHLLFELPPSKEPAKYIGILKQTISRKTRQEFPEEIKKARLKEGTLWTPSYFVTTTGGATTEAVQAYIQSQVKPKRTYSYKNRYIKKETMEDRKILGDISGQ